MNIGVLLFGAATIGGSIPYLQSEWTDSSTILGIPTTWYVLPLPIAAVIFIVYALDRLRTEPRRTVPGGCGRRGGGGGVIIAVVQLLGNALGLDPTPVLMIVLFVALLALAVPMAIVFTLVPWMYLAISRQTGLEGHPDQPVHQRQQPDLPGRPVLRAGRLPARPGRGSPRGYSASSTG